MKIMIVDDEVIIRTGLATVIKWHDLGLQLLEPAASAEEAIARIPFEKPAILLTDIRMTGKNGLELAEEAKAILPELDIIILTGFDDFNYTQKAIRQGVNDYLLKTSRPDDIIRTVLRAKQRLEAKLDIHSQEQMKQLEFRNRLFEKWIIQGDIVDMSSYEELLSFQTIQQAAGDTGEMQVWIIAGRGWNETPKKENLLTFAIDNICRELLECETLILNQRVVAIVPVKNNDDFFEFQRRQAVLLKIESLLRCTMFTVVGKAVTNPEQLHESYVSAQEIFPYRGLLSESILLYEEMSLRKGALTACTQEEELRLTQILLEDDPLALKNWVHHYIEKHLIDPQFTLDSLETTLQAVVTIVNQWLSRVQTIVGAAVYDPSTLLFRYNAEVEPTTCLFQYVHSIMKVYHHHLMNSQASHVQKAKGYIESNIGFDISLQQVAKHVHIHPSHLSELFKKETGNTFSDYVTKQRIKRASQLLSTTTLKINEIATTIGYTDIKYFSQLFKKETGITPSEYREITSQQLLYEQ